MKEPPTAKKKKKKKRSRKKKVCILIVGHKYKRLHVHKLTELLCVDDVRSICCVYCGEDLNVEKQCACPVCKLLIYCSKKHQQLDIARHRTLVRLQCTILFYFYFHFHFLRMSYLTYHLVPFSVLT
jgi:hypothetical protein